MPSPAELSVFTTAFREHRFDDALAAIDALLAADPEDLELHWQRVLTLEELGRVPALLQALETVLLLEFDYVPAIVKRAQYAGAVGHDADTDDDADDTRTAAELEAEQTQLAERARIASRQAESELRRALELDPAHPDALFALSQLLRHRGNEDATREADTLLDTAITHAPERVDLYEARAMQRRSAALRPDVGDFDDPDLVHTLSGATYSRALLESACADYARCLALSGDHRHAVRVAGLLHDMGRFDEALASYDQALTRMRLDDPAREAVLAARARSEGNGLGEREELASLLESALDRNAADRSLQDHMAAQVVLGTARAVRAGRTLPQAIDAHLGDDPDSLLASSIAQQILDAAHEPPPGLVHVAASDYPRYQRKFADRVLTQLDGDGLQYVADAEATGLFDMLGQHVLVRFFSDATGEIGAASFAMKPKWPGLIAFLILFATGKWKSARMIECVTQFDDGTLLSTQLESVSPFRYGGAVQIERMPATSEAVEVYERHLARVEEYRVRHPQACALVAHDLEGMEQRWCEGQRVKREYRRSVGYVTDAELRQLLGAQYDRFAAKVRARIDAIAPDYA